MKAITPTEATRIVEWREFPDFVVEAFNSCIKDALLRGLHEVNQEEVIMRMMSLNPELKRQEIFDKHYLDVENYYQRAGWTVQYHKPAYWEAWEPYWEFKS